MIVGLKGKAHLALIVANIIYGLNYVISKEIMPYYISPKAIIFARVIGSFLSFALLYSLFIKEKVERKDKIRIAFASVFGIAINQIMFFEGLNLTSTINSAIIMTINPILVLLLTLLILKERITLLKVIGIISGIAGALIIIFGSASNSSKLSSITGDIFILINAASFAYFLVLIQPIMKKYSAITVSYWLFLFGSIIVSPICVWDFSETTFELFTTGAWYSLIYIILGTTVLGYVLYIYALKNLSPVITSSYIYSQPLIASFVAILIGQDSLTAQKIIASILIFGGVYLTSFSYSTKK
jgi:drug/metabolite transporter (DMT)-like permease